MLPLAQSTFFSSPQGSAELKWRIGLTLVVGFLMVIAFLYAPSRWRRPIIGAFTFAAGLYYVLLFFWPKPIGRTPGDLPRGFVDAVGFWLGDAVGPAANIANILTAMLLGLGIYSLLRIHLGRLFKGHRDRAFSVILLISLIAMTVFGYWDWLLLQNGDATQLALNPQFANRAADFLFDGLLQQMDAAMFSMIAFFILSAAYRAFRIRSIESTILLGTALIVMLSFMGGLVVLINTLLTGEPNGDPSMFINNFSLSQVSNWIVANLQTPSLRAIDFGIGIGALAMGLRLWLSLERGMSS